jgi:alpha-beta hydrolase superfamily lysophospholipase
MSGGGTERHRREWRASAGVAAREAVLMLHGMESHSGWFEATAQALGARGLDAHAYDRTGFGRSPGARGACAGPEAVVAELAEEAARIAPRYERLHLVGLSWGGLVAAYAMRRLSGTFASATLLVPTIYTVRRLGPRALVAAAWGAATGRRVQVALPLAPEDFTDDATAQARIRDDAACTRAVDWSFLRTTLALQGEVRTRAWLEPGRIARALGDVATAPRLPLQVLVAQNDALLDNWRLAMLAARFGAPAASVLNAAHSLVLEAPDEVAARVAALADEVRGATAPTDAAASAARRHAG